MNNAIKIYLFGASLACLGWLVANPSWPILCGLVATLGAACVVHLLEARTRNKYEQEVMAEMRKLIESNNSLKKRVESMETRTGFGAGRTPFPVG